MWEASPSKGTDCVGTLCWLGGIVGRLDIVFGSQDCGKCWGRLVFVQNYVLMEKDCGEVWEGCEAWFYVLDICV